MHLEGSKNEKFSAGGNPPPQIAILENSRLGKKNIKFKGGYKKSEKYIPLRISVFKAWVIVAL